MKKIIRKIPYKLGLKKHKVNFLVFWCGTKCSLHCKNCCNLIPYIKQESFNANEILEDFAFLSQKIKIGYVQIQGGEIFTHPNAAQIINALGLYKNIDKISLTTNGSIVPKLEVIEALKNNPHIRVTISNYQCIDTAKRQKLIDLFEQNHITYHLYEFLYDNGQWFDYGNIYQKRTSKEQAITNYRDCHEKYCITFADGFLYACGKIRGINEIYGEDMVANKSDYQGYSSLNIRSLRYNGGGGYN